MFPEAGFVHTCSCSNQQSADGVGRCGCNIACRVAALQVIKSLREREIPVVIDADGLFIVTRNLDLVRGNPRCVLTPNKAEFGRLAAALDVDLESGASVCSCNLHHSGCVCPRT